MNKSRAKRKSFGYLTETIGSPFTLFSPPI
jgi:hypothetical protein